MGELPTRTAAHRETSYRWDISSFANLQSLLRHIRRFLLTFTLSAYTFILVYTIALLNNDLIIAVSSVFQTKTRNELLSKIKVLLIKCVFHCNNNLLINR